MLLYKESLKEYTKNCYSKQVQQGCRLQDPYTKISCISIQLQWMIQKWNEGNNCICNYFKKNKIFRNKINKRHQNLNPEHYKTLMKEILNK